MLWGWLQERRKVGSYDYAGCLSLPRIMYISGNRLIQVSAHAIRTLHVLEPTGMLCPANALMQMHQYDLVTGGVGQGSQTMCHPRCRSLHWR